MAATRQEQHPQERSTCMCPPSSSRHQHRRGPCWPERHGGAGGHHRAASADHGHPGDTIPSPRGCALSRASSLGTHGAPIAWGDLGPFNPGLPVEVPVWLAINLKQRQKCRVIPPEWMDVGKLEEIRDQERKQDTFTRMPSPYYMELTKLLLNYASDNIPKADEIRTLVKDTWDTRIAKLRLSADSFVRQQEVHAKLDNLTLMEINTTGTFLTQALDRMYKLRTNLQPGEAAHSQDF
ncbi:DNA replication complex GINS protein PSF2 isoform X1 [Neopsephotus bourkii]|uniref:DNA replication complex GINS protein PSF2 isoform X1 n=1 Tax=Neopsephotus bourkii TaxID=309878 RepID=UPI002AA547AE|nr:DNA replication complex GINS protein PSF2 isoform X1 [Neopsephotus bourkii]XP_061225926.1 DNA replication complex GINS protein PSF2 isoform X1 [Neopsephotus bourkii]